MSVRQGIVSFGSTGTLVPTKPAPISAPKPTPKMVSARPVAT